MNILEILYANDEIEKKYSKKKAKFLKSAIFYKYEIIQHKDLPNDYIYICCGKSFQFEKTFHEDLKKYFIGSINSFAYRQLKINYTLPELEITDDFLIICDYFKGQRSFSGKINYPQIEGFDKFLIIFKLLLQKKSIENFSIKELYKVGLMADFLICDFVKIACYNTIIEKDEYTSTYYGLKLLNKIKTDYKKKYENEISFIINHEENLTNLTDFEKRKLRKIIKYFAGMTVIYYGQINIIKAGISKKHIKIVECSAKMLEILKKYDISPFYDEHKFFQKPDKLKIPNFEIPDYILSKYYGFKITRELITPKNLKFTEIGQIDLNKIFFGTLVIKMFNYSYICNSDYLQKYFYNITEQKYYEELAYMRIMISS